MAKRITSGKRDREKIKQEKREQKQKRKDERQTSGTRSFEEMIAYVDAYGQLHETPPIHTTPKIAVEDIAISVPKQEEIEVEPLKGRIEHFNSAKGYGFVKDLDSAEKYFFHISSAPQNIACGDLVTFEIERGTRGMNAVRLSIITQ